VKDVSVNGMLVSVNHVSRERDKKKKKKKEYQSEVCTDIWIIK
jgi:hypothetical protein